jgi:hypothetical protein
MLNLKNTKVTQYKIDFNLKSCFFFSKKKRDLIIIVFNKQKKDNIQELKVNYLSIFKWISYTL